METVKTNKDVVASEEEVKEHNPTWDWIIKAPHKSEFPYWPYKNTDPRTMGDPEK